MKVKIIVSSLIAAGAIAVSTVVMAGAAELDSCCTPADQDWPTVSGNLGQQSYTSLSQITKVNINRLGPAWIVHVSAVPATTPTASPGTSNGGQQTSPIAVNGVVYSETPDGDVIAVDGATGAVKWKWHPTIANSGFGPTDTRRGLSVGGGRVYTLAAGNRVVALNQTTGAQIWAVIPTAIAPETTLGNIAKVATMYYNGKVYIGTNDGNRNAFFALDAATGAMAWTPFYGGARAGTTVTDVNGKTWFAGDTWMCNTDGSTPCPAGTPQNTCALTAGASPWIHGSIDPALNMVYVAFGNVRSCGSSQDGSTRPGVNLFSNSMVALDATTGAYKWHFQSNNHGQWDMDNTHNPTMADVTINGEPRKVIYYGTKQGRTFVLDRTTGLPALPVENRVVVQDSRQNSWPTQPYPAALQQAWLPDCIAYQNLGSEIPGLVHRAVPNYNGYQAEPDPANPGQLRLVYNPSSYIAADDPFVTSPYPSGPKHRGCMNEATWDLPVLSTPSQNGGADWSGHSYSHKLGLYYIPYGTNPTAHDRTEGGNGLRPLGQYQTGGIVAMNGSTNRIVWQKELGLDQAHGVTPLATATDLLFMILTDGNLVAWDAATGQELWRFQTGVSGSSGVISYMVDGEQYIAVLAAGTGIPYNPAEGDNLWAFKLGGAAKYTDAAGNVVSGSSEAPTPRPLTIRRPVGAAVEGTAVVPNNTVYLARASRTNDSAATQRDTTSTASMNPQHMRVPVGTTVTFLNPGAATFPNFPNQKPHCATQFFEGKFNPKLNPGESFQYTFDRAGEYFYNDCTDPRPTGKVVAYLVPEDVPGAVVFTPNNINMKADVFTQVNGVITAQFDVPNGYKAEGGITLKTPLSTSLFSPVSSNLDLSDGKLVAQFSKADIDNNVPAGDAVPLVFTANFLDNNGVQKQFTSTATVKIVK